MVRSYLAMLPRLSAEETLDASTSVALGSGTLKNAKRVEGNLRRAARAGMPARKIPLDPGALADMGIGMVTADG